MAGQIVSKGAGAWMVRVFLGRDENGKRRYLSKTIHGNKKDAERFLAATLRDRDLGVRVSESKATVSEYLERWLTEAARPKVTEKTLEGYRACIRNYVSPRIGSRPLSKLTGLEVQTVYNEMRESGLSPRTVQYTGMILKQALKQAVQWRILTFNPCDAAKPPRQEKQEMQALSPDEARRFLAVAREDHHAALWELALTTGARPSEYLALKWEDVDWKNGTVRIQRSIDRKPGGGWSFGENKTRRSRRPIKLHGSALDALRRWRERQDEMRREAGKNWNNHGLVFTAENGSPLDRLNLARRNFRRILERAGLAGIRLYDLRHTYATLALSAGVPAKVVSEQLGHSGVALTLDTYSHVLPHMQDDAVAKVEALLSEPAGTPPAHQTEGKPESWHTIGTPRVQ